MFLCERKSKLQYIYSIYRVQDRNQEFFVAAEISLNMDSSINVSCMEYNRKALQWKKIGVFCPRCSKNYTLNENITHRLTQTGHPFSKNNALLLFFYLKKRAVETFPPLVMHLDWKEQIENLRTMFRMTHECLMFYCFILGLFVFVVFLSKL